jgi:hypothetical protein
VGIDPRNHNWDIQLESGLPDCRVKPFEREKSQVQIGRMMWDLVYCAQCFKPQAAVTPNVPHVFFICDLCVRFNGPPPDCIEVKG